MTVPKLRFPEFSDDWTVYKLSDFTKRVTRKNSNNESDLPLTISSLDGLISQSSFFDRQIASKDMSGYFLLKHGEFAYNKSYSKGFEFGSIKRLDKYPMGTLSTLYICFHLIQNDSDFMKYYFDSLKWYEQVYRISAEGARNHGLLNVSPHDFFSTKHVLPVLPEQKKIADFLSSFDKRIETTQKKLATLEKLKKGFMQKIFSQQLRFKDDNGNDYPAWEEKKLGDISNVTKLAGFEFTKYVNYSDTGKIIALRGLNIKNGKLILNDVKYIDNSDFSKLSRSKLKKGDILLTYIGTIGECALITEDDKYYLAPNVAMIRMFDTNPRYMIYFFQCDILRRELYRYTTASSQEALTMENVRKMKIFRPVFPEQKKIADFLSAFDEKMNLVRKEVDTLQTIKKGLLQQMFV